jgi:succinate semialdehyde reductase
MFTIKQPSTIIYGKHAAHDYKLPKNSLIITSKGSKSRGWLNYLGLTDSYVYDGVEPNPSLETTEKIIEEFESSKISYVIGLGGGSSLDVGKYVGWKLKKSKIMIPTTFGSGSEVTRIAVLKVDGKKQSFHDDGLFADIAIIDSFFIEGSPREVIKNSAIDACAQCTEAFDSKAANMYTKFLCQKAFDLLEDGILNLNYEKLVLGSLMSGLGFGNSSTTLGHALSYVYSNEGFSHGHALAFTTTIAHRYNNSIFYERFLNLVRKLDFLPISIKISLEEASEIILRDRKHLDNNPKIVSKTDIISLLQTINSGVVLEN